jgi:hypothetical protein
MVLSLGQHWRDVFVEACAGYGFGFDYLPDVSPFFVQQRRRRGVVSRNTRLYPIDRGAKQERLTRLTHQTESGVLQSYVRFPDDVASRKSHANSYPLTSGSSSYRLDPVYYVIVRPPKLYLITAL